MSIARALSNAMSGLTAVSRGTETVAANLANASTPGYARREVELSPQSLGANGGGVRIHGIARIVNAGLLAETRLAEAARSQAAVKLAFTKDMETMIGLPGEAGSLGNVLTAFQAALLSASARPDDNLRLSTVIAAAEDLAHQLNTTSKAVQEARTKADAAIASEVAHLNASLERVAYLNRRIAIISAEGSDASSLQDERQAVIGQIASIVPVQEVLRDNDQVALFTTEGAVLLDGSKPIRLGFQPAGQLTPEMTVGTPPVGVLQQDSVDLSAGGMRLFAGGSLAANFAIRDELAPQLQHEIDSIALELYNRLSGPDTDPSLANGEPGLFTNAGGAVSLSTMTGLAGRISVNSAAVTEPWRIRAGLAATTPGEVADPAQLLRWITALDAVAAPPSSGAFEGQGTLSKRMAELESRIVTRRVFAESDSTIRNSRHETITSRFMSLGVDGDFEMQRLLQYEHAYAANARVIQAIDEMMDHILRI